MLETATIYAAVPAKRKRASKTTMPAAAQAMLDRMMAARFRVAAYRDRPDVVQQLYRCIDLPKLTYFWRRRRDGEMRTLMVDRVPCASFQEVAERLCQGMPA